MGVVKYIIVKGLEMSIWKLVRWLVYLVVVDEVQMNVIYGLVVMWIIVDNELEVFFQIFLVSDFCGCYEEMVENLFVVVFGFGELCEVVVYFGDQDDVYGVLW